MKHRAPLTYSIERLSGRHRKSHQFTRRGQGSDSSLDRERSNKQGFTIVELLIVIVAYNGIQERANDSAVQADLSSNAKIVAMYHAEFGTYPTPAQLGTNSNRLKFTRASYHTTNLNRALYCRSGDGSQMSLIVRSKSGRSFYASHANLSPTVFPTFAGAYATDCSASGVDSTTMTGGWISGAGNGGIWASWVD